MSKGNNVNIVHSKELALDKYASEFQTETVGTIEANAPWPISYDVDSTQSSRFTEFSYTDCLRGFYINTQSIEMNCRIIDKASRVHCDDFTLLNNLKDIIGDKYVLGDSPEIEGDYQIGFMVGHNMFDIVSNETVARLAFENEDFYLKLHPLTNQDYARKVAFHVGWHRIIRNDISAYDLLKGASTVWTSTASELTMAAVILGKEVKNLSNFFNEPGGIYYPISKILYRASDPRQALNNIINCEFSGLLLPGIENVEQRVRTYFDHALAMRDEYGSLSSRNELKKTPTSQPPPKK